MLCVGLWTTCGKIFQLWQTALFSKLSAKLAQQKLGMALKMMTPLAVLAILGAAIAHLARCRDF